MSDTEEDSLSSDSWPVNEDWLLGIIKKYHNSGSAIKVTVSLVGHTQRFHIQIKTLVPFRTLK